MELPPAPVAGLGRRLGVRVQDARHDRGSIAVNARRLRVLMLGWVNSPHVEALASAMQERECDVHVGGVLAQGLPDSVLPDAGIAITVFPAEREVPIPGARAARHVAAIRRLVRDVQPDVIHAHYMPFFPFLAVMAGVRPLIASAWGSDVFAADRSAHWRNRIVARRANMVIADSGALLDSVRGLGMPPERGAVVNWGVDLERFSPPSEDRAAVRGRLGLGPGQMVLSPRIIKPVYNIDVLVQAFETIAPSFPDARLVLKHPDTRPPDLPIPLDPERVRLVGHIPHEQMVDYYHAADVCVSIPSSDSSPRSVWEAMACGCPCVVSDLPWAREVLKDEREALLVPIERAAVARAIGRVLSEPDFAASLAARGREFVDRHQNRRAEMDQLASIYATLVQGGRRTNGFRPRA